MKFNEVYEKFIREAITHSDTNDYKFLKNVATELMNLFKKEKFVSNAKIENSGHIYYNIIVNMKPQENEHDEIKNAKFLSKIAKTIEKKYKDKYIVIPDPESDGELKLEFQVYFENQL